MSDEAKGHSEALLSLARTTARIMVPRIRAMEILSLSEDEEVATDLVLLTLVSMGAKAIVEQPLVGIGLMVNTAKDLQTVARETLSKRQAERQ